MNGGRCLDNCCRLLALKKAFLLVAVGLFFQPSIAQADDNQLRRPTASSSTSPNRSAPSNVVHKFGAPLSGSSRQGLNVRSLKGTMEPKYDSARASSPARLVGRIEELANAAPISPLRESSLEEHVAKQGSYPAEFKGLWSGPFVIIEAPGKAGDMVYPGRHGNGKVGFVQNSDGVTDVDPLPIVFFEITEEERVRRHLPQADKPQQFWIGFAEAKDVQLGDGSRKTSHNVRNEIKMLPDHTLQQQILERSQIYSPRTQQTFDAGRESVFQFRRLKPNLLDVYLAAVEYKKDGTLMSRIIMHGQLARSN